VASAVLLHHRGWTLVGSVVGVLGSPAARLALEALGQRALTERTAAGVRFARRVLARGLADPEGSDLQGLREHSLSVSKLAWSMARLLRLQPTVVEDAALVGVLHDVGMRELEDRRMYRHPSPGSEERRRFREHVVAGERLVRRVGLDTVAEAIRHHHERWDGGGYPDRLAGSDIPLLARLVHVAEVYDTLTSPSSYRSSVGPERAISVLRAAAGQQFDPDLVEVLARLVA
jgi:putative nucleotidyltransferase with HDIG domain